MPHQPLWDPTTTSSATAEGHLISHGFKTNFYSKRRSGVLKVPGEGKHLEGYTSYSDGVLAAWEWASAVELRPHEPPPLPPGLPGGPTYPMYDVKIDRKDALLFMSSSWGAPFFQAAKDFQVMGHAGITALQTTLGALQEIKYDTAGELSILDQPTLRARIAIGENDALLSQYGMQDIEPRGIVERTNLSREAVEQLHSLSLRLIQRVRLKLADVQRQGQRAYQQVIAPLTSANTTLTRLPPLARLAEAPLSQSEWHTRYQDCYRKMERYGKHE